MANKDNPQLAISDFNMQKLTTKELSEHIAASIQIGENIMVVGQRGCGKTAIAKQQIAKSEFGELYSNLSVFERTDIGGFPNVMASSQNREYVNYLLPQFYEKLISGNQKMVWVFDEVDKCDSSLWAPLLEITQFRSINGRPLPMIQAIIMTGNLICEGGARPALPLCDRSEKYLVEADVRSWMDWAGASGCIHPSVSAYINDHPQDLFGAVDPEDRYADPSPRGWDRASQILFKGEELGWGSHILNKKVSGCVGKNAGIKYSNYYEHYMELLPMVEQIFNGKDVAEKFAPLPPSKQVITCMIVCARLAAQLDEAKSNAPEDLPPAVKHVGKFFKHVEPESVLISVRSQITVKRLVKFNLDQESTWKPILAKIHSATAP
jgi:energy-coupling factor transporter ATP-binding protein EcfA2